MIKISQRSTLSLCVFSAIMSLPGIASAELVKDSKASLELRNMYLNRDFRSGSADPSYGETWAHGFIAKFESGYTEGTLGVGMDALGLLGVKLDSSQARSAGNMLPLESNGDPVDEFSQLGLTAKARLSKSTLHVGTLMPTLPVAYFNNTRLLPSSFTGGLLTSQEIDGLTVHASHLDSVSLRDSSNRESVGFGAAQSAHFETLGGLFALNPNTTAGYYYSELKDIYSQHYAGLVSKAVLSDDYSLNTDLRYFKTNDDGAHKAGRFDSDFVNGMFSLSSRAHRFGLGFQNLSGEGVFPFMNGADPYNVNLSTFWTFTRQEEDAWQLRYDYDFAAQGIPGLTFMTRYVSGFNIETADRKSVV